MHVRLRPGSLLRLRMLQAQLEDIVPRAAISRHLAELAHLYEATCPVIADLYALIAPLSPESLPQSASGVKGFAHGESSFNILDTAKYV